MSAGSPYGRIVSSILKKLSLGQLNIEHQNAQSTNSLPRTRSQQENSTNPEDGHVWKDEWRTRGYSRWPLTNSQFGKLFSNCKFFRHWKKRNLSHLAVACTFFFFLCAATVNVLAFSNSSCDLMQIHEINGKFLGIWRYVIRQPNLCIWYNCLFSLNYGKLYFGS